MDLKNMPKDVYGQSMKSKGSRRKQNTKKIKKAEIIDAEKGLLECKSLFFEEKLVEIVQLSPVKTEKKKNKKKGKEKEVKSMQEESLGLRIKKSIHKTNNNFSKQKVPIHFLDSQTGNVDSKPTLSLLVKKTLTWHTDGSQILAM